MSFSKQPTETQIGLTLWVLQNFETPVHRDTLCVYVCGSIDPISDRLVRLCITALQEKGYLIFASNGYMLAGDDPEPVIHYLNGLYSRRYKLGLKADNMFHELKRKYGDEVAKRVEQLPQQSFFSNPFCYPVASGNNIEPPFHKSYDTKGNEIDA